MGTRNNKVEVLTAVCGEFAATRILYPSLFSRHTVVPKYPFSPFLLTFHSSLFFILLLYFYTTALHYISTTMLLSNILTYACACYWIWGIIGCQRRMIHDVNGFGISSSTTTTTRRRNPSSSTRCPPPDTPTNPFGTRLCAQTEEGENDAETEATKHNSKNSNSNWLERWAMEGAQKIAALDIQERTQRTLLAEMAEDKIYELNIDLEKLIDEDTGEISDIDKAKDIALQTRSLQEQYRLLVTGEPSSMLQAMASLKADGGGGE
jgi:hypothetical protein